MSTPTPENKERKVVVANYNSYEIFKIPKNVDLENTSVVSHWGIKWNKLYIEYVNGKVDEIHCTLNTDGDYGKYPSTAQLVNYDEWEHELRDLSSDDDED